MKKLLLCVVCCMLFASCESAVSDSDVEEIDIEEIVARAVARGADEAEARVIVVSAIEHGIDPRIEFAEMLPGVEYQKFDIGIMFDGDCLDAEYAEFYPCLVDENGCITRAAYEEFMQIWMYRTPEPGIPLCDQL